MGGGGKEGDWDCGGCGNRNYGFRTVCNRCKQPRLLVDSNALSDSKWLPRIGDWICNGCSNNNYASREKCKKCGQPKEVAAVPAIAMPGASLINSHYFAKAQGGLEQTINTLLLGNGALHQPLPLSSNWSLGGADAYGVQPTSTWPLGVNHTSSVPYANQANQLLTIPNGWRNGDWMCTCGFHNYSSRGECKKCNAPMPPNTASSLGSTAITALGTKRLASEEFIHEWDNKRLNAGQTLGIQQAYPGVQQIGGSVENQSTGVYFPSYPSGSSAVAPNLPVNLLVPHLPAAPALLGKGAKHWRDGDWMCKNCNNHNYASRAQCNRCKTQREVLVQPVNVA